MRCCGTNFNIIFNCDICYALSISGLRLIVVVVLLMTMQVLKTQDEEKVKNQFVHMAHGLFLQVFTI